MTERLDHEKMRRASELPAHEGGATDTLAASGGLELPGRDPHVSDASLHEAPPDAVVHEPIPGERDNTTLAATQPGVVGTTGYGVDLPPTSEDPTLDEATRKQIRWEAGGSIGTKRDNNE